MGKMFDSADRFRSSFLKPAKSRSTTGQSRSGPISLDSAPTKWLSQKLEPSEHTKNNSSERPSKRSALWSWSAKVAGVFHHSRAFRCIFSIHIHSIQDLPVYLTNNMLLEVHCLRKGRLAKTLASRALNGSVDFEETLHLYSNVRASKQHPHTIKHPVSKSFKLVVVSADDQTSLGQLTLDLGSILPCAIAETEDYASESAWTSAFKLGGSEKLRSATVVASMGYEFVASEKQPSWKTESCRFPKAEQTTTFTSTFWRRLRPLSGLVNVQASAASLFTRTDSLRSMPDLTGLAQEVCSSSSDNEEGGDVVNTGGMDGLVTGSDRRLDNMLCSLIDQQRQSSEAVEDKPMVQVPVELSKEEFSMDDSTAYNSSEEDDTDILTEKSRDSGAMELAVVEVNVEGKVVSPVDRNSASSEVNIYDEAEIVARQFFKMLENTGEQEREEPLGSPVYEANWILTTIPEEEDEEEVACISIAEPLPKLEGSCYNPPLDVVDLQAFIPTWRKEDDLDLASIIEAAENELQKVTNDSTNRKNNKVQRGTEEVMNRNEFDSWRKLEESLIRSPRPLPKEILKLSS